jgi:hypothetical protein
LLKCVEALNGFDGHSLPLQICGSRRDSEKNGSTEFESLASSAPQTALQLPTNQRFNYLTM